MSHVDLEIHHETAEKMSDTTVGKTNEVFSLAKNVFWAIAVVVVAFLKFQQVENVNESQDKELKAIKDREVTVADEVKKLNGTMTQILISLAELRATRDTEQRFNSGGKPSGNR